MAQWKNKEEYDIWAEDQRKKNEEERIQRHKLKWENLGTFNEPTDVPDIPIVEDELYRTYYIPKLIEAGAIPKKDLIDGQVYIGDHRRCTIAKWNTEKNVFEYWRHKMGVYIDKCNHFEDDIQFAVFVPIKLGTEEDFNNTKNG